jgi:putative transposase
MRLMLLVREKVPLAKRVTEVTEIIERSCDCYGISRHALERGCRQKACTEIRKDLVRKLVFEIGLSYAGTAPLLGVSASAVCQIIRASIADGE